MTDVRPQPVVMEVDRLEFRYPRPPFRQMAAAGEVPIGVALYHMSIYDSLGKAPPTIDFVDLARHRWPPLWRAAIDLARQWWEDQRADFGVLPDEYRDKMNGLAAPGEDWSLVRCAGGPSTRARVSAIFPLDYQQRARVEYFERLGWPHSSLLKDIDAFEVSGLTSPIRGKFFWVGERARSRRLSRLGDVGEYSTRAEAEADFVRVVTAILEERERSEAAKREAKKLARKSVRVIGSVGVLEDRLASRYPKPNFRRLAIEGKVSVRCALVHMSIYDWIVEAPHSHDSQGLISQWHWAPLWRAGIDQLRTAWERRTEDIAVIQREHQQVLQTMFECAEFDWPYGATARRKGLWSLFPLWGGASGRIEHFERLGWPHDLRLRDSDGFLVGDRWSTGDQTGWEYYRYVGRSNGRNFGEPAVYSTYAEAVSELDRRVFSFLDERERAQLARRGASIRARAQIQSGDVTQRAKGVPASKTVLDVVPIRVSSGQRLLKPV